MSYLCRIELPRGPLHALPARPVLGEKVAVDVVRGRDIGVPDEALQKVRPEPLFYPQACRGVAHAMDGEIATLVLPQPGLLEQRVPYL